MEIIAYIWHKQVLQNTANMFGERTSEIQSEDLSIWRQEDSSNGSKI